MKKILCFAIAAFLSSCSHYKNDDALILPPNFAEMPDVNNPEKPAANQKDEDVKRLKELLLKSEN